MQQVQDFFNNKNKLAMITIVTLKKKYIQL